MGSKVDGLNSRLVLIWSGSNSRTLLDTKSCLSGISDSIDTYCSFYPDGLVADQTDCAQYYDCSLLDGPLGRYKTECPYPQVFDSSLSKCRDDAYVNCGQRNKPATQCK